MNSWIQKSDFTSDEFTNIRVEDAIKQFVDFDWMAELNISKTLNEEPCDPGFGLVCNSGTILHVCPKNSKTCYVRYHYPITKKIFGVIPITKTESHYIETVTFKQAEKLIEFHFLNDVEEIINFK